MATVVATLAGSGVQPKGVHAGVNHAFSEYSYSASGFAAGDVVNLMKLPDGARLVDFALENTGGGGAAKLSLGTAADHDLLVASATLSLTKVITPASVFARPNAVGKVFDVSDAATQRFTMLQATFSDAAMTLTGVLSLSVSYTLDQP
ncbi:hypothetical protein KAR91_11745 [Candidatus Pacearchaeota archaeon]|nr:hypothetical protein [Candidatus Pacearchaeota archaeon]